MYIKTENLTKSTVDKIKEVEFELYGSYKEMPKLGVLSEPIVVNGWRFVPRNMDDTPIPPDVDCHVVTLKKRGVPVIQEIVGHNLADEEEKQRRVERNKQRMETAVQMARGLFVFAGAIVSGIASLMIGFISFVLAVDPVLIVVLEDGTWLCVAEWDN